MQLRTLALPPFAMLVLGLALPVQAGSVSFLDSEMADADWVIRSEGGSPPGLASHTFGQETSGGNPGAYRQMTHVTPVDPAGGPVTSISVIHERSSWVYDPASQGAIESIDLEMDRIVLFTTPGSGGAVGHTFRIIQGGNTFFPLLSIDPGAFSNTSWQSVSLLGLSASQFVNSTNPATAFNPDFSSLGGPIMFAYARSNSNTGQGAEVTTIHGVDNFGVTIQMLPEPSAAVLVGIGLIGLLAPARRLKKRSSSRSIPRD